MTLDLPAADDELTITTPYECVRRNIVVRSSEQKEKNSDTAQPAAFLSRFSPVFRSGLGSRSRQPWCQGGVVLGLRPCVGPTIGPSEAHPSPRVVPDPWNIYGSRCQEDAAHCPPFANNAHMMTTVTTNILLREFLAAAIMVLSLPFPSVCVELLVDEQKMVPPPTVHT